MWEEFNGAFSRENVIKGTSNNTIQGRAVDPHSFFKDPDPAVFPNADPDPA